jgi:ABC-2 type transport system ATP-binding protein
MKMKLSIAIALAHHAKIIIMDEPTSGLDPIVRNDLAEILKKIVKEDGCSIFFSTHIISDLEKVADRIIYINNGQIVLDRNKQELLEEYRNKMNDCTITIEDIMVDYEKELKHDI